LRKPTHDEQQQIAAIARIGVMGDALRQVVLAHDRIAARDALIASVRPAFRRRVRELHPDLHPGDAAKAEELRHLLAAWGELERWSPVPARPAPTRFDQRVAYVQVRWGGVTDTSTTGSVTGGWWRVK
jgi:hypothetical protein